MIMLSHTQASVQASLSESYTWCVLQDGRIAYVDFGNVAQLSQRNKQILIDAVVHAVNEDYRSMAEDFIKLGFLSPGVC